MSAHSRWTALGVLLIAVFIGLTDATIANITLSAIETGLGASDATLSWVVTGYALAYGLSLVPAGRLGDRYGHKPLFVLGMVGYVLTGVIAATASSEGLLIAARVAHGIAGGVMVTPVFAYIQVLFTGAARVRAFGLLTVVTGIATSIGPLIGGWIIDNTSDGLGWRLAFLATVPVGLIGIVAATMVLPNTRSHKTSGFDVLGMAMLAVVIFGAMAPLIQTDGGSLPSWAPESFGVAFAVAIAFVYWQRRRVNQNAEPLIPMTLFRYPSFSLGLIVAVLTFASATTSIYIALAVLWQSGRGETALAAGLVTLPFSVGAILGAALSERVAVHLRRHAVTFALALLVGGYVALYFLLLSEPYAHLLVLTLPIFVAGLGSGIFVAPNVSSILSPVPPAIAGGAGGVVVTAQRIGAALGTALTVIVVSTNPGSGPFDEAATIVASVRALLVIVLFAAAALVLNVIANAVDKRSSPVESVQA
ncbi:MFS transporter [Rhodococcus wratislaviensis]|uniref:MFS transporter n=1 Tax=Rhodococcus wratislaviensis TaxID=44752 RepID=UPI003651056F